MKNFNPTKTPIDMGFISNSEKDLQTDVKPYGELIGCLSYVSYETGFEFCSGLLR